MASNGYFYGSLKPTNKREVSRQTTKREGLRASADSSWIGGTVRISHSSSRECDIVTFDLDGGNNGTERFRIADAVRPMHGGEIVLVPCSDLLRATSDETWSQIFQEETAFAKRMAALLFANLDAVQRG
jgi:hypothetical protein